MSVVALKQKTTSAISASISPTGEIKENIQVTLKEITVAHRDNIARVKDLTSIIESWNARVSLVGRKIEDARKSNPEAIYSLEVMEDQAKRYALGYTEKLKEEREYGLKIEQSIPQLTTVLRQLEAIEKVSLLDEKLQKITAGTDIAEGRLQVFNTREIQTLIHTAHALVELKKEK